MKANTVFEKLCDFAPLEYAMGFDNAGFLIGDGESEVKNVVVCLDATTKAVDFAIENNANLIITHHPIIFNALKSITPDSNNRVFKCLTNGISVISMHTNLDIAVNGVNDTLAKKLELKNIVSVTDEEGFSFRKGILKEPMSADGFAKYLKSKLGGVIRFTDSGKTISAVAVCGGSGGDFWGLALKSKADALVTADVKHSCFIDAAENNFSLFDAGHFHTENVIVNAITERLQKEFGNIKFLPYNTGEIKTV